MPPLERFRGPLGSAPGLRPSFDPIPYTFADRRGQLMCYSINI